MGMTGNRQYTSFRLTPTTTRDRILVNYESSRQVAFGAPISPNTTYHPDSNYHAYCFSGLYR